MNDLKSLVENLTAGLFYIDEDDRVALVNLNLTNILSLTEDQLVGQSSRHLFGEFISQALNPEVVQVGLKNALLNLNEKPTIEVAIHNYRTRYYQITFFPVYVGSGPKGWGGFVQEITELRERAIRKNVLLSDLAQDIRSPLASLRGYISALRDNFGQWNDDMVQDFLETISEEMDTLTYQVDQSLALTKIEAGNLGLRLDKVEVGVLVQQALEQVGSQLELPDVQLDIPIDLPPVRVDPAHIEEIFIFLISNAVQESPEDKPVLIQADAVEDEVTISVIDQGRGIPSAEISSLFDLRNPSRQDSRLPLDRSYYISQKIIEAHGGKIWVESPPKGYSHGTAVSFTLVRVPELIVDTRERAGQTNRPTNLAAGRILVVEREADYQALFHAVLSDEGYSVELASDGQSAVDILESTSFDLVLINWLLDDMTGIALLQNIRRFLDVPILMVGSQENSRDLVSAFDAGADDYVVKPVQSDELLARIHALIQRQRPNPVLDEVLEYYSSHGLTLDFKTRQVWLSGEEISLTSTEFDLLAYLVQNEGMVLTYQQLIDRVWPRGKGGRHALSVHISRLRKKIELEPDSPRYLHTKWGIGYIFSTQFSRE